MKHMPINIQNMPVDDLLYDIENALCENAVCTAGCYECILEGAHDELAVWLLDKLQEE